MSIGRSSLVAGILCCCCWGAVVSAADYPRPAAYLPTLAEVERHKALFDDPRPYLEQFGPKQVLPPDFSAKLRYDADGMKREWAALVGLAAPQEVGKIAPEIRPGRYTSKDLDALPGLRALMSRDLQSRIRPGGPPLAGSIPEFEIIPTRQYYWAAPVAAATKKYLHAATLDRQGYLDQQTWLGGYPFPRPSGPFKAQQILYNVEKRALGWDQNFYTLGRTVGYTEGLRIDFEGAYSVRHVRLAGRSLLAPFGFFDEAARRRGESKIIMVSHIAPRDYAGGVQAATGYLDPDKPDALWMYLPAMRRVRKLAPRDTQDDPSGRGRIYDDTEGFGQKLSPVRYPYRFEVLEEREYLVPAPSLDGAEYLSAAGAEFRNVRLERRPLYVIKLTQLDPGYVYGSRILHIDRETFLLYHIENYDQEGRLYRTWDMPYSFFPEMGMFSAAGLLPVRDHINRRSTVDQFYSLPAAWSRTDMDIEGFLNEK